MILCENQELLGVQSLPEPAHAIAEFVLHRSTSLRCYKGTFLIRNSPPRVLQGYLVHKKLDVTGVPR